MKVSFGIINYNRLFYLKSCAETLMESVKDYPDVEFICIDDNSKEPGTQEYLDTLRERGWKVIDQEDHREKPKGNIEVVQNVIDALSDALNLFVEVSTGDLIAPLHGDMQFVRKKWLKEYVSLFEARDDAFCINFDAQRKVRLEKATYEKVKVGNSTFAIDHSRIIPGAGDCMYRKDLVEYFGGWNVGEEVNAEDLFTHTATQAFYGKKKVFVPWLPPSIAIYTDPRGTMGRVRGNKRFGKYWEALDDNCYYEWINEKEIPVSEHRPASIEEMAFSNGNWELPKDEDGAWKKNPINWPAEQVDFEVIFEEGA